MERIVWDFSKTKGKIKPVNGVNNGPTLHTTVRSTSNSGSREIYEKARFPYARNHDASLYEPYGGEHIVDVHRIFKNFNADENDPASYWFEPTDAYVKATYDVGTKMFYRLGASIEHYVKYGTYPPADFAKWARICEHIIMHYTEGWANGFHYDMKYWEIWCEPDCFNRDGSNPCWQGTDEQFIELFDITAKHLKNRFPHLKIGGPSFCSIWRDKGWFLSAIKELNTPLDFFSYHWYGSRLEKFKETLHEAQRQLELYGFKGTETILDEYNYVRSFLDDVWVYSLENEKTLKGSSFILGAMCCAQEGPLDKLMYYNGAPSGMNGIFNMSTFKPYKLFYTFVSFADMIETNGDYVPVQDAVSDIYACASKGEDEASVIITYFNDNDDGYYADEQIPDKEKEVVLEFNNLFEGDDLKAEVYLLDEENDNALVDEFVMESGNRTMNVKISLFSNCFIKFKKIK